MTPDPARDAAPAGAPRYRLRLYVAGRGPNSRLARENLDALCAAHPDRSFEVEVVDVEEKPQAALERGVFVTPALEILEPPPGGMIYGNLSKRSALRPFFPNADKLDL
jgi:circadian clock protein KaiB